MPVASYQILQNFFEKKIEEKKVIRWGIKNLSTSHYQNQLKQWVQNGYHAKMDFMERYLEQRLNPKKVMTEAESILLFSIPYTTLFQTQKHLDHLKKSPFKIASYALGKDYHIQVQEIIHDLLEYLKSHCSSLKTFSFCDSAPIFERDWASEVGLGWRGKNCCTIHPKYGSSFLLGGLLFNEKIQESLEIVPNYCGSCRACLDACPTNAFVKEGVLDSNKCISYWTIEEKGEIPLELSYSFGEWVFGCDICQEVCPWNQKYNKSNKIDFPEKFNLSLKKWILLLKKGGGFQSYFKSTPLLRAGRRKLFRNLMIAIRNLNLKPTLKIHSLLKEVSDTEDGWVKKEILLTIHFLEKNQQND